MKNFFFIYNPANCKQYLADWNVWSETKTQEYSQLLEAIINISSSLKGKVIKKVF